LKHNEKYSTDPLYSIKIPNKTFKKFRAQIESTKKLKEQINNYTYI